MGHFIKKFLTLNHRKIDFLKSPYSHHTTERSELLIPKIIEVFKNGYTAKDFSKDLIAGITVGIVALPLAMAFAISSGVGPIYGLYTSIIAGIIGAFLGGSRFQISGPTGAFVIITYSIVYRHGYEGLVLTLILAGIILILAGLFRLGSLIKFIPYTVTMGFTAGIGVVIFSQQIADFFGMNLTNIPPDFFEKWTLYFQSFNQISLATLGISLGTFAIMFFIRKYKPKFPAPVIGVIFGILIVWIFDIPVATIGSKFGELPTHLPQFNFPEITFERIQSLLPDAITIAFLAAIESLLTCVVADSMTGDKHYSNMELIAQGLENLVCGFFGGITTTGGTARTVTNINSGGTSPIASLIHAFVIIIFIFLLSPLLAAIPLASLAVVLMFVAYGMVDVKSIAMIMKAPKSDWSVMLLTFILTVTIDLTVAVYIGVSLASLLFMKRMSDQTQIIDNIQVTSSMLHPISNDLKVHSNISEDIKIVNIDGPLFFGVADRFQSALTSIGRFPKIYIIHLKHVSAVDATGLHALEIFMKNRNSQQYSVIISSPTPETMILLNQIGIIRQLGENNICNTLDKAIERAEEILQQQK